MPRPPELLITEAAAMSSAGAGLRRHVMGPALIGAGEDATVVIVASGDDPGRHGVQDATKVLLRGDRVPDLQSRFTVRARQPVRVFARLDRGCLPLGTARYRGGPSEAAAFDSAELALDQPLTREMLDVVRPVAAPGPVPGVEWVDQVAADPIRALESFVLGWFPAGNDAPAEHDTWDDLPAALTAIHRLARLRPAIHEFHDPVLRRPRRVPGPSGERLVFAVMAESGMGWSVLWPPEEPGESDPRVRCAGDPYATDPETSVEVEPLSRFLLQFTLYEAMNAAPFHAWTSCMPAQRLTVLSNVLRPVPLSPFLPAYQAERCFVAPGLLAHVSGDDDEAVVSFGALHRATLTPLLDHDFPWSRFDG